MGGPGPNRPAAVRPSTLARPLVCLLPLEPRAASRFASFYRPPECCRRRPPPEARAPPSLSLLSFFSSQRSPLVLSLAGEAIAARSGQPFIVGCHRRREWVPWVQIRPNLMPPFNPSSSPRHFPGVCKPLPLVLVGRRTTASASLTSSTQVGRPPLQPRPSTASSRARSAPPLPAYLFTEPGLSPW